MLNITDLTCRIAGNTLIENSSFMLYDGWKMGLVGANGSGKSTLFRVLIGEMEADNGEIELASGRRIGILRQEMPDTDAPILDVVLEADEERAALLAQSETESDPYKIADIHTRLNDIEAWSAPSRAAIILTGLGFSASQMDAPFSSLSGGWRVRVALAAALFSRPEFLLLDEPTNHLDLEATLWLEDYLKSYPQALLIISHDRRLLNKCTDHILHLENKTLTSYTGNYDQFEKERAEKRNLQQKMHVKQQAKRAHIQKYVDRFRYQASKAKQAQSRIKALERMDIVQSVLAERAVHFRFPQPKELAPPIITLENASVGYEKGKPILTGLKERIDMDDRIALLGANGNGKSTLIKLLCGRLDTMEGDIIRSGKLKIGYFSQHQMEEIPENTTPYAEMAKKMPGQVEPKIRAKLGAFGFSKPIADNPVESLSGGEKARLLFALLSFDAPHLLLLDEPTNHLDMESREALTEALNNYKGAVVIVSHDAQLLERTVDRLWLVKDGKCETYEGDMEAYKNFILSENRAARREDSDKAKPPKDKNAPTKNKARRRQEAAKRRLLAPLTKKAKAFEKEIENINTKIKKLEIIMADPALYDNKEKSLEIQAEHAKLTVNLVTTEESWVEIEEKIQAAS